MTSWRTTGCTSKFPAHFPQSRAELWKNRAIICPIKSRGGPGVPPLRTPSASLHSAPSPKREGCGRVRTPAPTRIQGRPHSSRRGRSQTGPVCRPCIIPELSRGAPWGSRRDTDWDLGAPPHPIPVWPQGEGLRATTWGRPYGGKRTEGVGSAKVGAEGEPHQNQILQTQGLVARRGFRVSLRFCAPEGFCLLQGITPVMGDRG